MHKAIQAFLADLLPVCCKAGLQLCNEKEIAYGIQLEFAGGTGTILLNVYYSEKKGISTVINGSGANVLRPKLESCLGRKSEPEKIALHKWQAWIGSDECGKGDYFGPIIVCSFFMKTTDAAKLKQIGVCDSKKLNDKQIVPIAKKLYADYPDCSHSIILKPAKYNEIYAGFVSQRKNLNDLLAWQHAKNIDNLLKLHPETQGVLIDQFSPSKKAGNQLRKSYPDLQIAERPGAEADLAVAAASIMARYQLIYAFESMSKFYKLKFPKGASKAVKEAAKVFVTQYGKDRLGEVAKLHFKTTKEIRPLDLFLFR